MGVSRAFAVVCFASTLIMCSFFVGTMGKVINYGVIEGDRNKCKSTGDKCLPNPANRYDRGCVRGKDCRNHNKAKLSRNGLIFN
ncbi:hypothetical protein L484_013618 [Morus notabilis]|uniref:Uncharacterized protein n=1 Tax=Morus notabilis TaxID=981085 RepID=W9QM34_9ROSA|nr:hypothetical protein L484_013618 [Morus notabilis]